MPQPAISVVRIIAEGVKKTDGTPLPPGTILSDPEAWRHCFPGYRNAPPIAEPADPDTIAWVDERRAQRAPIVAAHLAQWQKQMNKFATDRRLTIDPATGTFALTADGQVVNGNKLKDWELHVVETAMSHGIKPQLPATPAPAPAAAAPDAKSIETVPAG